MKSSLVNFFNFLVQFLVKLFLRRSLYKLILIEQFCGKYAGTLLKSKIFMGMMLSFIKTGHLYFKLKTLKIYKHISLSLRIQERQLEK